MTHDDYSVADLTVLEFDESVRKRPGMYFGLGRGDPRLATEVFRAVLRHALHPAAKVAPSHTPRAGAEITADLAFSVTDDQADTLTDRGVPELGYYGSLLTSNRWLSAAASAVSSRATVEVWRDGRGFRQELIGIRPAGPPAEFPAPAGAGTHVAFTLDGTYVGPSVITTALAGFDLHGPDCSDPTGPGYVVIRDRRVPGRPAEYRCD